MVFIDHSDLCKQTIEPTLIAKSHPKTIENMISPDKRLTVVKNIASNKIKDHSLKSSQLQRMSLRICNLLKRSWPSKHCNKVEAVYLQMNLTWH